VAGPSSDQLEYLRRDFPQRWQRLFFIFGRDASLVAECDCIWQCLSGYWKVVGIVLGLGDLVDSSAIVISDNEVGLACVNSFTFGLASGCDTHFCTPAPSKAPLVALQKGAMAESGAFPSGGHVFSADMAMSSVQTSELLTACLVLSVVSRSAYVVEFESAMDAPKSWNVRH